MPEHRRTSRTRRRRRKRSPSCVPQSALSIQHSAFSIRHFPCHALRVLTTALLVCLSTPPPAAAQSVWELTPYQVKVWATFAPAPELTPRLRAELLADLRDRLESLAGAAWRVSVEPAPPGVQPALGSVTDTAPSESFPQEPGDFDKIILLAVAPAGGGYRVTAREFDVRTQLFSPPVSRPLRQLGKLRDEAVTAVFESFAPLARVENVDGKQVTLRLKAAVLPLRDRQLVLVEPGDVFRPVIRYQDHEGNLRKDRRTGEIIRPTPIAWTFCTVQQVDPSRLHCRLHTGFRSPLSGRRRGRVQQLALAVVPPRRPSTLTLRRRAEPEQPLVGYEVYARPPDSKATVLLGCTDRQGQIVVPPAESPLRILLARNGQEVLARLPMVPGLEGDCLADIPDDDPRLQAEGLVGGVREELVDLVTRREVLAARARARIEAGQLDQAEELIDQLLRLTKSEQELSRTLAMHQRSVRADDPSVQRKIDALFADTQKLLREQLRSDVIGQLRQEVHSARSTRDAAGS